MRGHTSNDLYRTALIHRRLTLAVVTAAVALAPAACAFKGLTMAAQTAATLHGDAPIEAPSQNSTAGSNSATTTRAETYNPALAPQGGHMSATLTPSGESTNAEFTVSGLQPNRSYAVQAHVNTCGGVPDGVGPIYQNRVDPAVNTKAVGVAESSDPQYANPQNEVWLDVRTDGSGSGTSRATLPFVFTDRGPGSIVVTDAEQTSAGKGGTPVACLTLSAVQPKGVEPRGSR
jgi:superoxide dismutase, Cu-Zn family